jgi:hypothetical protein
MTNTKLAATGNLTAWWGLSGAFASPAKPTVAELNACLDITTSIAYDSFGFGTQASNKNSDPSWADTGNVQTRGFANYGGNINFFYPAAFDIATDQTFLTWDALDQQGTLGYLIFRFDGTKVSGTAVNATTGVAIAIANDFVRVYKVQTDGWTDVNTGEVNFKYGITFQPQGQIYVDAVVATTAPVPVLTLTGGGSTMTVAGGKKTTVAYRTGRQLATIGTPSFFTYSSSDGTKATIDSNGTITPIAAGVVTFTATDKVTGAVSTGLAITLS